MLRRDNLIIALVLLIIFSCSPKDKENRFNNNYFLQSDKYIKNNSLANQILDTLLAWQKDSLNISLPYQIGENENLNWQIVDLIIVNSDSTRLFTFQIKSMKKWSNAKVDYIEDLAGAKINGKWYFFFGSSTVIDRATYQDSIYSPLTFDELSYLARKNLSGAFYKDSTGEVKVRESFFDFMDDPNGWGLLPGSTRKDIDSVIVARNKEMHTRKIDPKEIEHIKAEMTNSVRPKEPIPDIKWYEKIFPKKKKLFETDEWKDYVKSKNKANGK
jgi:hypothetical protein